MQEIPPRGGSNEQCSLQYSSILPQNDSLFWFPPTMLSVPYLIHPLSSTKFCSVVKSLSGPFDAISGSMSWTVSTRSGFVTTIYTTKSHLCRKFRKFIYSSIRNNFTTRRCNMDDNLDSWRREETWWKTIIWCVLWLVGRLILKWIVVGI